jgi:intracellular sulfur oxidation DsrE/DsrF family protein
VSDLKRQVPKAKTHASSLEHMNNATNLAMLSPDNDIRVIFNSAYIEAIKKSMMKSTEIENISLKLLIL